MNLSRIFMTLLLLGMFTATAAPSSATPSIPSHQECCSISMEQAKAILKRSAPRFGVDYDYLLQKYLDNECTIVQTDPKVYKVSYGGMSILVLEETL